MCTVVEWWPGGPTTSRATAGIPPVSYSTSNSFSSNMAEHGGAIFFNVDYRLAPEAKCPENIKDFYSVLKYVINNAASLGVDPARVAIMGESGGGYLTAGLCVMLAQKDEAHLVKLAVPVIPMVDDYAWNDPSSMTK
jgi:acetyl esterase/lipase